MFQVGDYVQWKRGGGSGTDEGKVVRIATESGRTGDFVYNASKEFPRYIIETGRANAS
ncbi:MAG: DUF2945 domain-containing protein [Acidobacteria bacterium]|nr:DUF2945 domain-containing protein [Acidobacteriota bacterium]